MRCTYVINAAFNKKHTPTSELCHAYIAKINVQYLTAVDIKWMTKIRLKILG
jgi:hypothetical protein